MAQMLVRNIDDRLAERFRAKAKAEGKSAEQLARELIAGYAGAKKAEAVDNISAIRAALAAVRLDPVALVREDRDRDDKGR